MSAQSLVDELAAAIAAEREAAERVRVAVAACREAGIAWAAMSLHPGIQMSVDALRNRTRTATPRPDGDHTIRQKPPAPPVEISSQPWSGETISVAIAADRLRVGRPTVYRWIEAGSLGVTHQRQLSGRVTLRVKVDAAGIPIGPQAE